MFQKYLNLCLLLLFLGTAITYGQEPKNTSIGTTEDLSFYPNPVANGKIYITSKNSTAKEITIYDVLGKRVLQINIAVNNKEVNVSALNPGVYIIKIKEGEATATRKLIVK